MPFTNDFLSLLRSAHSLTDVEEAILLSVGVQRPEELLSLVRAFPVLGDLGMDLAKLSSAGLQYSNQIFAAAVSLGGEASGRPLDLPHGAQPPPNVPGTLGTEIPMPSLEVARTLVSASNSSSIAKQIDLRLEEWPVRHQGARGTCVAFALVACREHLEKENATPISEALSEQYLYWAAKGRDPWPNTDGTGISYAKEALEHQGTCLFSLWPYQGSLQSATEGSNNHLTQETATQPSQAAHTDAGTRRHPAKHYAVHAHNGVSTKKSAELLALLQINHRPVAIAIPVFSDPIAQMQGVHSNNWNASIAKLYGSVLNPPPRSVATAGHAVCVTGFQPDVTEPSGGYFIFRNSWGTEWATSVPATGYYAPEPGYGQISATYIDNYLWEMCSL